MSESKRKIKKLIYTSIRPLCKRVCIANKFVEPGHYYSPIPNGLDYESIYSNKIADYSNVSINFHESDQLDLLKEFHVYAPQLPSFPTFKNDHYFFSYNNFYYSYSDTLVLFCFLNHFSPQKIIDIGGGDTTGLMVDIKNRCDCLSKMSVTAIQPNPHPVLEELHTSQSVKVLNNRVQDISLKVFEELNEGDIVFLDSTHVSKLGSDVNYIMFQVLPVLKKGVIVHVHDIYYTFEYPADYYSSGKYWNEIYLWQAFLMHNTSYKILMFNSWLEHFYSKEVNDALPGYFYRDPKVASKYMSGSSLWLQKL